MANPPTSLKLLRRVATSIAAVIGCGLALALALSAPARAYTNSTTGVINLNASVALVCSVSVNAAGATTVFPNMTQGASGTLVGTVVEICNDANGYRVTLSAANGAFKGASTGALIRYTLTYNGSAVDLCEGAATVTPAGLRTTPLGVAKPIAISFRGGYYAADSYSETLTLTMVSE